MAQPSPLSALCTANKVAIPTDAGSEWAKFEPLYSQQHWECVARPADTPL